MGNSELEFEVRLKATSIKVKTVQTEIPSVVNVTPKISASTVPRDGPIFNPITDT